MLSKDDSDLWTMGRATPGWFDAGRDIADVVRRRAEQHAEKYQQGVAITASRTFGDRLALYATPAFVAGTHAVDFITGHEGHDHDVGLERTNTRTIRTHGSPGSAGRLRFSGTGYITGEYTPRLHGYDPNSAEWGVRS